MNASKTHMMIPLYHLARNLEFCTNIFQLLLNCFNSDLENNTESNEWNLEHNADKLQGL